MPSCNRQVTSTSITRPNQARLALLAVTHRYGRISLSLARTISDRIGAREPSSASVTRDARISHSGAQPGRVRKEAGRATDWHGEGGGLQPARRAARPAKALEPVEAAARSDLRSVPPRWSTSCCRWTLQAKRLGLLRVGAGSCAGVRERVDEEYREAVDLLSMTRMTTTRPAPAYVGGMAGLMRLSLLAMSAPPPRDHMADCRACDAPERRHGWTGRRTGSPAGEASSPDRSTGIDRCPLAPL
jgi:hypothetical protein